MVVLLLCILQPSGLLILLVVQKRQISGVFVFFATLGAKNSVNACVLGASENPKPLYL